MSRPSGTLLTTMEAVLNRLHDHRLRCESPMQAAIVVHAVNVDITLSCEDMRRPDSGAIQSNRMEAVRGAGSLLRRGVRRRCRGSQTAPDQLTGDLRQ
jgi:hypothetical protein